MTKKLFFVLAAATTLFFSCNKQEISEENSGVNDYVGLVVKVSVPTTKTAYTDEGASGLDLTLTNSKDRLIAYFRNSGGSMLEDAIPMNLDPSTLSVDKKSGTFKAASPIEIPEGATSIFFYLDNEDNGMYSLTGTSINDLKSQSGTLEDVAKHQVIVGNANVASLATDGAGNKVATISFEYRTSVLKFAITFPDGVTPTADENTTITINDEDVYNSVGIAWGAPHTTAALNSKGAISFHPASVSGQVATAYVTVWGDSEFDGATLDAKVGDFSLNTDFETTGAAVAGKMHNVARTITAAPNMSKWVADDAADVDFLSGLTIDNNDDAWISYNSSTGKVSFTENATGKPRKGAISFTNGSSVEITQIEVKDFKGTYSFRTQRFSNNAAVTTTVADVTFDITITDPLVGETVTDYDGASYTNNLGLRGLYLDAVADAVMDIDYFDRTIRFGLFLDERKAQPVANGNATYPYVCFIPEGGTTWNSTTMAAPWKFVPIPISDKQNYQWLWFEVSSDFNVLNYDYGNKQVMIGSDGTAGTTIIGITCAIAKNATPSDKEINTTYNVIYQANPNKKSDTGGFTITRK